jgi:RNA polymerase sigma factor (sigma-70 family)
LFQNPGRTKGAAGPHFFVSLKNHSGLFWTGDTERTVSYSSHAGQTGHDDEKSNTWSQKSGPQRHLVRHRKKREMLLLNDKELCARFREGDRTAMEAVYDYYIDPIARFLSTGFSFSSAGKPMRYRGATQRADLHDLIAETFRRAFEQRARLAYDQNVPYLRYLKQIARNIVIDRLRAEKRLEIGDQLVEASWNKAMDLNSAATPEKLYQQRELDQLMRAFVDELPKESRQFIELRYAKDLSQDQLAKRLGTSRRWVRNRERKLRSALMRHLRATGYLVTDNLLTDSDKKGRK